MNRFIGKGQFGVLLLKCGFNYNEALELVNQLEEQCIERGYTITVEADDEA